MLEALLLAAVALQLGLRVAGRPSLASRLLPLSGERAPFLIWAARLWISFFAPTLAALLLLGRVDALWRLPPEFDTATRLARSWGGVEAWPILTGLALGSALGAAVAWWRGRRGKRQLHFGRPPRLPERRGELPAAVALAMSAGVAEEAYFRLLAPFLVTLVSGSALVGVAASVLLFGLMHRYQGWVGMVATGTAGLFLSFVHLASGSLWLAMLCHAIIDLNGLVIRPALGWGSPAAR